MTDIKSYRVKSTDGQIVVQEFEALDDNNARDQLAAEHPKVTLGDSAQLEWRKGNDWIGAGFGSGKVTGTGR